MNYSQNIVSVPGTTTNSTCRTNIYTRGIMQLTYSFCSTQILQHVLADFQKRCCRIFHSFEGCISATLPHSTGHKTEIGNTRHSWLNGNDISNLFAAAYCSSDNLMTRITTTIQSGRWIVHFCLVPFRFGVVRAQSHGYTNWPGLRKDVRNMSKLLPILNFNVIIFSTILRLQYTRGHDFSNHYGAVYCSSECIPHDCTFIKTLIIVGMCFCK